MVLVVPSRRPSLAVAMVSPERVTMLMVTGFMCEGDPKRISHSKTGKQCVLRADVSVPTATHG